MVEFSMGSMFAGHRIEAVAGRGGMGVVYRATQLDLGRSVALKVIAPELAEDSGLRDRFVNESRVAASIDHPNVIPIFYAGEERGVLYIAMRFVVGTDLRRLVRAEGRLEPDRALHVLQQVAAALDAAHERGLVHRDVKPANVLLTGHDHAYLTDFGLTRHATSEDGATRSGAWVGTLDYVAPEQIRGERLDARADVYALGCLLYFLLAGEVPFPRDSDEAKMWAHLHEEPPALAGRFGTVPEQLDAVIRRAMSLQPEDRFPSAGDVARAALAAAHGRQVIGPERQVAAGSAAPWEGSTVSGSAPAGPAFRDGGPTVALPPERASPWVRRLVPWGLGVLAVVGVAVGVAVLPINPTNPGKGTGDSKKTPTPTPTPAGKRVGDTPVGQRPNAIAVEGTNVWVASSRGESLTRIDARSGRVRDSRVIVGRGATDLAAGYGSLWVTNSMTRQLLRISTRTRTPAGAPLALPQPPVAVVAGGGAVWVGARPPAGTQAPSMVLQVDRRKVQVVRTIPIAARLRGMAVGDGAVWVVTEKGLSRISIKSGEVRDLGPTGSGPKDVAVGAGSVWVTNAIDSTVAKIELPSTHLVTIPVASRPSHVGVLGDDVWVTSYGDHSVSRINPKTSKVVQEPVTVGRNPFALAVEQHRVWITQVADNTIGQVSY